MNIDETLDLTTGNGFLKRTGSLVPFGDITGLTGLNLPTGARDET